MRERKDTARRPIHDGRKVMRTREQHDISDRRDVACLVNVFYDRVRADDILGPIFDDIAHVDWAAHLPTMYR